MSTADGGWTERYRKQSSTWRNPAVGRLTVQGNVMSFRSFRHGDGDEDDAKEDLECKRE